MRHVMKKIYFAMTNPPVPPLCPQITHIVNIFLVTGGCRGYTPLMAGKTETLKMRLTPEEKASFLAASELSGLSLSAWIRERLRRSSRIELEEAGEKVPFRRKKK